MSPSGGNTTSGYAERSSIRYGTPARRSASSRPLARLPVARTSSGSEDEVLLVTRRDRAALQTDQPSDALPGQRQQLVEARLGKGRLLGGALHLDEGPRAGHHHVHVDLGGGVLHVVEVEH